MFHSMQINWCVDMLIMSEVHTLWENGFCEHLWLYSQQSFRLYHRLTEGKKNLMRVEFFKIEKDDRINGKKKRV